MRSTSKHLGSVNGDICPRCGIPGHILGWDLDDKLVLECEDWLCRHRFTVYLDFPTRPGPVSRASTSRRAAVEEMKGDHGLPILADDVMVSFDFRLVI